MRITTDDALRRIDSRWLGPPGFTFPWPATRYIAYGVGTPVVVLCVLLATQVFGEGFWTIVYAASIGVLITTRVMRLIDDERPAVTYAVLLWAEISAPRGTGSHSCAELEQVDLSRIAIFLPSAAGGLEPAAVLNRKRHEDDISAHPAVDEARSSSADDSTAADCRPRQFHRQSGHGLVPVGAGAVELPSGS